MTSLPRNSSSPEPENSQASDASREHGPPREPDSLQPNDRSPESLDSNPVDLAEGNSIDVLWRQFGEQLRRRARTRLRQYGLSGQAESMDICNDVMADLARRQGTRPLQCDDVLAYVLRAIDHQVLDTFRTLARQCRDFRRVDSMPLDESQRAQQMTTPSQLAVRREVLDKVREMLSSEDRQALEMMLENRDWNEIGNALGMRPDTARMRVRRAIQRVRDEIGVSERDND